MRSGTPVDRGLLPYLLILSVIFSAGFFLGMAAPSPLRQQATEAFQDVVSQYQDLAGGTLFFFILLHNVMASILLLFSGLLLGIIPVMSVVLNGFFLGVLYRQAAGVAGYAKAALKVAPHGIFEIPALLITASYALWIGMAVLLRIRGKQVDPVRGRVEHAFRRYFFVVFPLLVIAATIETALILWFP